MKRAVVTGGGGFIGLAVVRLLVSAGVETGVVCRGRYQELERLGVDHFQGDIRDKIFLDKAFKGADTVFHVAAKAGIWGDRDDYHSINVIGTGNVISSCRRNQVRSLVYTSTPSVVFDRRDIEGGDERLPYATRFLCHYAHTKAIAEKTVLAANSDQLRTTALRPHGSAGRRYHLSPRIAHFRAPRRRRRVATCIDSPFRGWLQQLLDQNNGHSRFSALRFCSKSSPFVLNTKSEKARCNMPSPSWHSSLLRNPSSLSPASTRISSSLSDETTLSVLSGMLSNIFVLAFPHPYYLITRRM